ncbi:MAG: hypothetical protein PHR43_05530 [Dehalococcoidales bacterium]|nr:hypothetical protein [Dehalococcoidales bacterium]
MFLKMRRSKEKEVPPVATVEDSAELKAKKIENLEELVTQRTMGLKEAQQQLNQLTVEPAPAETKEETRAEALFTQPNTPPPELKAEEAAVKSVDLNALLKPEAAAPSKEAVSTPPAAPDAGKPPEIKAKDDSLADLFNQDDEKENPLSGLIRSLPNVSASELLNEAKEVSNIIKDWRH